MVLLLAGGARVLRDGRILGGFRRVGYTEKPQHTLQDMEGRGVLQSRPRVWKRLRVEGSRFRHSVAKVPRLHQSDEAHEPLDRVGVG